LRDISVGTTASYTKIANRIGQMESVRAVVQAYAASALAVVLTCQCEVKSDGTLSGYREGVEQKRTLRERESRA
jgi:AraC family transcriptional regulator, regulatory protein of adaptative response / methylated-DNA-[protein]-cysteine methyltransferase